MSKQELLATLRSDDDRTGTEEAAASNGAPPPPAVGDAAPQASEVDEPRDADAGATRFDAFAALARARANGELVMLPRLLTGDDRRLHVRQTLREDHQTRIASSADDAKVKFDELADSLYSFFRGTCVPIFGVNDFDEAYYAPFTWDLKRGAVGFMLAADEEGGHGAKRQRKIARRFVRGYIDGIARYADDPVEREHQVRLDNAPKLVRKLIEDAQQDRTEWLAEDHHDEFGRGFRADDELVPVSGRRDEFQALIDRFVATNDVDVPARAGQMRVKDVAQRKGAGTASLGLTRYYVLIEGPHADGSDDLVIELKQARRSALAGLVPPSEYAFDGHRPIASPMLTASSWCAATSSTATSSSRA